jgi:hypothetical protein
MGWLDNSTNNIILDAVLTDYGREALARNNGSFNITKFSFGDDEVNYGIITKYGRTIGREKIEKNTPVFEALTNQNLALKYKLVSVPVPLVYLPKLQLDSSTSTVDLKQSNSFAFSVVQKNSDSDSSTLDPNIADSNFDVYYPSLFLSIDSVNNIPGQVSQDALRTAQTTRTVTVESSGQRKVSITLVAKSITNNSFQTYGRQLTSGGPYVISTSVKLVGQSSGLSISVPVNIYSN